MASSNAAKAAPPVGERDPRGLSGWAPDNLLDTPTGHGHQAPRRVHRKSGLNRRDERYRLTRPSAEALAEKITAYWAARGIQVKTWVERIDDRDRADFAVRSTLTLRASPPEGRP